MPEQLRVWVGVWQRTYEIALGLRQHRMMYIRKMIEETHFVGGEDDGLNYYTLNSFRENVL